MNVLGVEDKMVVLKDTSLCAIVRDEKMNPAGGVERFLRSHLPYVEEAVVIDTGSTDGTREILNCLEKEFAHLKIYDSLFGGYAMARNVSLGKLKTTWALILDADELLEHGSFDIIGEDMRQSSSEVDGFAFALKNIFNSFSASEGEVPDYKNIHNPRLFNAKKGFKYKTEGKVSEYLFHSDGDYKVADGGNIRVLSPVASILHFKPSSAGMALKDANWYGKFGRMDIGATSPAQIRGFDEWNKLNPHRGNHLG